MEKRDNIYENDYYSVYSKKSSKIKHDNTKHYPNKDEASLLRNIMRKTGLSEEQIRSNAKYRKMLSEAQKSSQKSKFDTKEEKFYKDLIKRACKETGLVPQHPDTLVVLQTLIKQEFSRYKSWFHPRWMSYTLPLKAETAVKRYAKS